MTQIYKGMALLAVAREEGVQVDELSIKAPGRVGIPVTQWSCNRKERPWVLVGVESP